MFDPDNSEDKQVSTFQQLELACLELAELSYKIQISSVANAGDLPNGFKPVYKGFVYSRMLWSKFLVNCFLRHYTRNIVCKQLEQLLLVSETLSCFTNAIGDMYTRSHFSSTGNALCNVGAMSVKNLLTLEMDTKIFFKWKWVILFLFSISFLTTALLL